MTPPLNVVIVGLGGMGHEHLRKLRSVPEMRVVGSFDVRAERQELARREGVRAYHSMEAVLADSSVDVVLIATPNDSHRPLAVATLLAGKAVICEKPVALNSAELEEILRAEKASGKPFVVHQNRRWDDDYLTLQSLMKAGTLGPVFHVESRVHGSRGIPGDWRKRAAQGGGMMLDWGVHLLDRLIFLFPGAITEVFCKLNFPTGQEVDEGFHLFLTFEGGQTALVEVSTLQFQPLPLWVALGTRGTAVIHDWNLNGEVVVVGAAEGDAQPIAAGAGLTKTMAPRTEAGEIRQPLPVVRGDVTDFYRNVAAVVHGRAEPLVKNSEVRRILILMEAAFESHRTGQVIKGRY